MFYGFFTYTCTTEFNDQLLPENLLANGQNKRVIRTHPVNTSDCVLKDKVCY